MPVIKFRTPHVNRMTHDVLIGKPIHHSGVLVGHVTEAVPVDVDGQPYWEITAEAQIEIETTPRFASVQSVVQPQTLPAALQDKSVVAFLLTDRTATFLENLDYDHIRDMCIAGVLPVVRSNDYIDCKTCNVDIRGVIGSVLGVKRVPEGLVVSVRFHDRDMVINENTAEAKVEYSLTEAPEVKITLAWAGQKVNTPGSKNRTACFYLTTRSLLQPL